MRMYVSLSGLCIKQKAKDSDGSICHHFLESRERNYLYKAANLWNLVTSSNAFELVSTSSFPK